MEQAADSALELLDYMLRNFSTNLEWIFGVKSIIYQAPDDPPDTLYVSIETGLLEKDLGPLCGQDYPFSKCEQGFEVPLTVLETWDPETGYATGDSAHSLHLERSATPCANTFSELISTIAPEDDNLGAGCDSYEFETLTEWHGAVQANSDKPANWIRIRLADLPPPCLPF